jgi:hypothetical protein
LRYEQTYARATADIAAEYCADALGQEPTGDTTENTVTQGTAQASLI